MTKHQPGTLEALAEVIAQRVYAVHGNTPRMHVVGQAKAEAHIESQWHSSPSRHRRLRITFRLQGLVPHAAFSIPHVSPLNDQQLTKLHADLERTPQCFVEGIAYEIGEPLAIANEMPMACVA